MDVEQRRRIIPAIILIVVGLFLLLIQVFSFGPWLVIGGLGLVFILIYYFWLRSIGLLIPGLIIIATGVFAGLNEAQIIPQNLSALYLVFVGAAFLLVYLLHTRHLEPWGARNWPLFPGLILTGLGALFVMVVNEVLLSSDRWAAVLQWWPIVLVGIGIWLLIRRSGEARTSEDRSKERAERGDDV